MSLAIIDKIQADLRKAVGPVRTCLECGKIEAIGTEPPDDDPLFCATCLIEIDGPEPPRD